MHNSMLIWIPGYSRGLTFGQHILRCQLLDSLQGPVGTGRISREFHVHRDLAIQKRLRNPLGQILEINKIPILKPNFANDVMFFV